MLVSSMSFAEEPWRFIVTCDSRGTDNGINQVILGELVSEIIKLEVDFVLFPGDLVYGYSAAGPRQFESQLRTWVSAMEPVYNARIAVYVTRGNHELGDVWGLYPDAGADPNDNYMRRWLNVFGSDFNPEQKLPDNGPAGEQYMTYSVTHKNAFIACLDQYGGVRHEFVHKVNQAWLDTQLAANTKPHIFVAGHEPAFQALHLDCLGDHPADRDAFWASLKNAGARTYLCGHDHFYDHARVDDGDGDPSNDLHQYIVGTAGATLYTWSPPYDGNNTNYSVEQLYHARRYGYVLVEIDGLDVGLTWMERSSNDISVPGAYEPNEFWGYRVAAKPIVLSPNGGESLAAASTYGIRWKTLEGTRIEHVLIEYSSDNGQTWKDVGIRENAGSYEWVVPAVDSDQCLMRVSDLTDGRASDTSDSVFTIFQCRRELAGDLNGDCYVNWLDFAILAGDLNGACCVDWLDIAILAGDWLKCANPFDPSCGWQQ
jgi:hypothetical protein